MTEIRWYKGKYKVRIIRKSNVGVKGKHLIRNILVETLEPVPFGGNISPFPICMAEGYQFTTVPRLLWGHPRK